MPAKLSDIIPGFTCLDDLIEDCFITGSTLWSQTPADIDICITPKLVRTNDGDIAGVSTSFSDMKCILRHYFVSFEESEYYNSSIKLVDHPVKDARNVKLVPNIIFLREEDFDIWKLTTRLMVEVTQAVDFPVEKEYTHVMFESFRSMAKMLLQCQGNSLK